MKQQKIEKKKKLLSSYCPQRIACSSQLSTFYKENKFGAFKISKKDNAELKINSILMQVAKLSSKELTKSSVKPFFYINSSVQTFHQTLSVQTLENMAIKINHHT